MSPHQPTTLFLSRHGQTTWHRENRYAGISDVDLTSTGRRQAEWLAEWTQERRPAVVVSSPMRRALETAHASAVLIGHELEVVSNLREVSFGVAEGRTLAELSAVDEEMVRRFQRDPVSHPFPEAESPESGALRGARALRDIAAAHPGQTVLVVGHNTLFRLALCSLLDIDVQHYRAVFPRLDNGTLSEIRIGADPPSTALLSLNVPLRSLPQRAPPDSQHTVVGEKEAG